VLDSSTHLLVVTRWRGFLEVLRIFRASKLWNHRVAQRGCSWQLLLADSRRHFDKGPGTETPLGYVNPPNVLRPTRSHCACRTAPGSVIKGGTSWRVMGESVIHCNFDRWRSRGPIKCTDTRAGMCWQFVHQEKGTTFWSWIAAI